MIWRIASKACLPRSTAYHRRNSPLSEPRVRPFDLTGRPMKRWLLVKATGLATDQALRRWLDAGVSFAASLPPKA